MARINPLRRIYDWFNAQKQEHVMALGMLIVGLFLAARPGSVALYINDITGGLLTPTLFGMLFTICGSALYTAVAVHANLKDTTLAVLTTPYFVYCISSWIVYVGDMARLGNAPIGPIMVTIVCANIAVYVRDR